MKHRQEIIDKGLDQFSIEHPEFYFSYPTKSEINEYTDRLYNFMHNDCILHIQRGQSVPIEHALLAYPDLTSIQVVKWLLGEILLLGIDNPAVKDGLISNFEHGYFRRRLPTLDPPYSSLASLTPSEFVSKILTWLRGYRFGIR
jgi:hypothetical protein